jgi:hypothetical protein
MNVVFEQLSITFGNFWVQTGLRRALEALGHLWIYGEIWPALERYMMYMMPPLSLVGRVDGKGRATGRMDGKMKPFRLSLVRSERPRSTALLQRGESSNHDTWSDGETTLCTYAPRLHLMRVCYIPIY